VKETTRQDREDMLKEVYQIHCDTKGISTVFFLEYSDILTIYLTGYSSDIRAFECKINFHSKESP